jgi:hypothetical protein
VRVRDAACEYHLTSFDVTLPCVLCQHRPFSISLQQISRVNMCHALSLGT